MDKNNNIKNVRKENITSARKKLNELDKKYRSGYPQKIFILKSIAFLVVIGLAIYLISNISFFDNNNTNGVASLNHDDYSEEILALYSRSGEQEKFEKYIDSLQSKVAIYMVENTTTDLNSFNNLAREVENILNSSSWEDLDVVKDDYYNGTYSIDENGNLKFKFASKSIEPEFAKISNYVILN